MNENIIKLALALVITSGDTFGPQPTTTIITGQAAPGQWGGTCPTCSSVRHVAIQTPVIHVVAFHR
jgi:hypothetical protein